MRLKLKMLVLVFIASLAAVQAKQPVNPTACLTTNQPDYLTNYISAPLNKGLLRTGGSIVVIGNATLEVTTDDEFTIETVQVYSGSTLVYSAKGCYETSCEYDLSSLSAGSYTVDVQTTSGFFSGPISVK